MAGSDPLIIKRVIDSGALGIVVPDVKNAEEAKRAVDACRYPPVGTRGIGQQDLMQYIPITWITPMKKYVWL